MNEDFINKITERTKQPTIGFIGDLKLISHGITFGELNLMRSYIRDHLTPKIYLSRTKEQLCFEAMKLFVKDLKLEELEEKIAVFLRLLLRDDYNSLVQEKKTDLEFFFTDVLWFSTLPSNHFYNLKGDLEESLKKINQLIIEYESEDRVKKCLKDGAVREKDIRDNNRGIVVFYERCLEKKKELDEYTKNEVLLSESIRRANNSEHGMVSIT